MRIVLLLSARPRPLYFISGTSFVETNSRTRSSHLRPRYLLKTILRHHTRDLYRCRRSSFLTNDTGEQPGICHPGHMPRYSPPPPPPLSSSSACSSPEHNLFGSWRARESKIGHLNSPVIAIILPAWKIYARGCYSCAIVRFHPEGGEKSRHRNPSAVGTEIYGRRLNGGGR